MKIGDDQKMRAEFVQMNHGDSTETKPNTPTQMAIFLTLERKQYYSPLDDQLQVSTCISCIRYIHGWIRTMRSVTAVHSYTLKYRSYVLPVSAELLCVIVARHARYSRCDSKQHRCGLCGRGNLDHDCGRDMQEECLRHQAVCLSCKEDKDVIQQW